MHSSVTASLSGSQPPAFIHPAPSPRSSTSHPSPASAREMYELPRFKPLSMSSPLSRWSGGTSRHVVGFNPPTRPRPAANPQLWSWFRSVGEHHRSEITADELQRALCNGSWTPLDLDTVYMLMDLIDTDRSGTVGFQEFVRLWQYISEWQIVFQRIDHDQVGSIDDAELGYALEDLGYNLSPHLLSLLEQKYAYVAYWEINFNGFVRACVSVKMLTDTFQRLDTDRDGWINLDYPSFLRVVLSAPAETNVDYTTFAGSNTERGAIPEEASVTTNVATSSSPQRLSIPDSSPFESHYSSGSSASHCQSPEDVVKKAKTLCDSVMIFQQSAFDIAELAELRMYSFMAWSTSIEGKHELQDSAEYDSFEAEMAAHEKMESFLSYKEKVYSRLNRDLELVVALLAFLSEGISQPGLPEDILLAFIMAWIILCDSTEVTIATTPKQRQTLNGSFLKALRYDVTDVSNAMSSSSSRMVSESRAGNQDFLDFDSIYKSLVVAFTEIVQPFLGSEYSKLELETAASRATLIKAAILHSPWLGDDQGLVKTVQDLSHEKMTGSSQEHERILSSLRQDLLQSGQTSSNEVMVPLPRQKEHQRRDEEAKTQSTVMDDVEMSESNTLDDIRGSHNYIEHNPKPQYSGGSSFPIRRFYMHLFNYLAMKRLPEPKPAQVRDGPDDNVTWKASITIDAVFPPRNALERRTFTQTGRTKQDAKDAAARDALIALGVNLHSLQD